MKLLRGIKTLVRMLGQLTARLCTLILLPLAYWTVFAATAVWMKLLRKQLLPRFSPDEIKCRETLWLDAPRISSDLEKMKKQF